jgi:hypothetical protein
MRSAFCLSSALISALADSEVYIGKSVLLGSPLDQFNDLVRRREVQTLGRGVFRSASRNWHCQPWRSIKEMYNRCRLSGAMQSWLGE